MCYFFKGAYDISCRELEWFGEIVVIFVCTLGHNTEGRVVFRGRSLVLLCCTTRHDTRCHELFQEVKNW